MRHFTHLADFTNDELLTLVAQARELKAAPRQGAPLYGKSLAFCFMNPSLRTQVSMEVAATQLGGHAITLALGSGTWEMEFAEGAVMDGKAAEHLKEAVPVLSRYCQALALRSFPAGRSWAEDKKEPYLAAFKKYATVPVINLESATGHPCQALADLMTIGERMEPRGKNFLLTWAPHVKPLPMAVPNSAAEIAAAAGMNVTIARPEGFDLDPEVLDRIKSRCQEKGSKLAVTDDVPAAYEGAHVVYAKSWGGIKNYGKGLPSDPAFRAKWMVTTDKMKKTAGALFMHCLPVRRNLVVADAVLDGSWSVVIDQAENRLHTAKAVLLMLLKENPNDRLADHAQTGHPVHQAL
jgi:N-acetylornithine carbamoyltransferase